MVRIDGRVIRRWQTFPIKIYASNLDLFDRQHQIVSRDAVAKSVVIGGDPGEERYKDSPSEQSYFGSGNLQDKQSQQYAGDEDYAPRPPVFFTNCFEPLRSPLE